jgi:molybdate transport system permease protein
MDYLPLYLSIKLACVSTVVLVLLTMPLAYVLAFSHFTGKSFLETLINLPLALPPTVVGFYFLILMGPKGTIGSSWEAATGTPLLFTFLGIAIAAIVYSLPFAIQPMKTAFEKIDYRLLESATILGLSRSAAFVKVIIPNSISGIAASAILVFIHSMGAFGVIFMIGGSIPGETKVASIAIYEAVEALNYREAGMMSMAFVPISFVFLFIVNRLNKSKRYGA